MSIMLHHGSQLPQLRCRQNTPQPMVQPMTCPNAVSRVHCIDRTDVSSHGYIWNRAAAAVYASCRAAVKRRHCAVWAVNVQGSQQAEEPEYEAEEEYEEYEEGELDEDEEGEEEGQEEESSAAVATAVKQIPMDQQSVPFTPDDFVEVGLISRPHGIKGEVKVQLITDEPKKRLGTAGRRLWLQPASGRGVGVAAAAAAAAAGGSSPQLLQRVTVQSGRVARPASKDRRAEWAVKFNEVPNRDKAEALSGHKLLLALCDRESSPRSRDEFFISDLVGLKALCPSSQALLGIVTEVYDSTGSYSLLRVRLAPEEDDIQQSRYRSVLVPFVEDMVPCVDVGAGLLQLALPEGLLETACAKKLRRPYTPQQAAQLRQQLKQRQQQQQQQLKQE